MPTSSTTPFAVILGAGLSGLAAARQITAAGQSVLLIDKGRSVGGRLATRRLGKAHIDHGAQFFTVRGDEFEQVVSNASAAGIVDEWCRGFAETPDGYPRYRGKLGMNQFAKWLAAELPQDLTELRLDTQVTAIRFVDDLWRLELPRSEAITTNRLIVTAPIPQTLDLLEAGFVELPGPFLNELTGVDYFATLALLVLLDESPTIPPPGGQQLATGPFAFVADNQQKGISPVPSATFHANHDYSARRFEDDPDEVLADLLVLAEPWLQGANVIEAQLKKWRYAGPDVPLEDRTLLFDLNGAQLALAGDAFGGPKVEGAFNSGLAAGAALLA